MRGDLLLSTIVWKAIALIIYASYKLENRLPASEEQHRRYSKIKTQNESE